MSSIFGNSQVVAGSGARATNAAENDVITLEAIEELERQSKAGNAISHALRAISIFLSTDENKFSIEDLDKAVSGLEKLMEKLKMSGARLTKEEEDALKELYSLISDGEIDSVDEMKKVLGLLKKLGSKVSPKLKTMVFKEIRDFMKDMMAKAKKGELNEAELNELKELKIPIGDMMGALLDMLKQQLTDQMSELVSQQSLIDRKTRTPGI